MVLGAWQEPRMGSRGFGSIALCPRIRGQERVSLLRMREVYALLGRLAAQGKAGVALHTFS